jgi:transposase
MEQISRTELDTSKHIFQLHGVKVAEEPVQRKKRKRGAAGILRELRANG